MIKLKDYEVTTQSIILDITYTIQVLKRTYDDIFDSLYFIASLHKTCKVKAMIRNNKLIIDIEGREKDVANLTHDILTFPTIGY